MKNYCLILFGRHKVSKSDGQTGMPTEIHD